jgi:hypothetical protein
VYAFLSLLSATLQATLAAAGRTIRDLRAWHTVRRALPRTCQDLLDRLAAAGGGRPSEVVARATAGPAGTLTAPLSGAECVWYAVRASERFWAYGPGPAGPRKVERTVEAAEHVSGPLAIEDDTGSALVDPTGARLLLGDPAFSGFDARDGGDGRLYARMTELLGAPPRLRHRRMTIGLLVEEWAIVAGEELRVVGRASGRDGAVAPNAGAGDGTGVLIGKTGRRPFLIARRAATRPAHGTAGQGTNLRLWGDRL